MSQRRTHTCTSQPRETARCRLIPRSRRHAVDAPPGRWPHGPGALAVALIIAALLWPCAGVAQTRPEAGPPAAANALQPSDAERAWLAAGHTVRARVADYPPYMLTAPQPAGIAVDHLAAVARRFGFKVEFIPDTLGFAASVDDVAGARAHYDLFLTFTRTPEREKQFALTKDYLDAPWVVYARRDSPYILGLESLGGKTLAAEKGFVITRRIQADYPAIRVLEVARPVEALQAVATGLADAYVGNLATSSYLIKANHLDNLVVTAPTAYGINTQAMAIRRDWPELAGLIDKGIAAMPAEERNAIRQKWGSVEFTPQTDYTLIWQIVAASTLIVLLFFYWNRKLAAEVALRKRAEDSLRESAAQLSAERDLLEQRVAERTAHLSEALEFNETVILNSPLPMAIFAASGQCVLVNEALVRFFGMTRDALLTKNFNVIPWWQQTSLRADCLGALATHTSQQNEAQAVTSFGKAVWFEYRIIPRHLKGEDHLLIQFYDLTERKAQQLELERRVVARTAELATARAEAESASAVKTRFMANVSHEMRTPMSGILGLAEVGRRSVGKASDEVIGACFERILESGRRLHKLTESLLNLAQDAWNEQAGIDVSDLRRISPETLVIQSVGMMEKTAAARGQRIVLEKGGRIPGVLGDEARLRQVLEHLLGNALRYSPEHTTVTVRIAEAPPVDGGPHSVVIQVIDQGCGIPEKELGAIFEPFYESSRTATGAGGSGLGLALSRSIILRHKGTLCASNRPQGGALFEITLPQAPEDPAAG